jgi:hypothetical protein
MLLFFVTIYGLIMALPLGEDLGAVRKLPTAATEAWRH